MKQEFRDFFLAAMGQAPYPHRERLAAGAGHSGEPISLLVNIPTRVRGTHMCLESRARRPMARARNCAEAHGQEDERLEAHRN